MKKRKLLSIFLTVMFIFSFFLPQNIFADSSGSIWTTIKDGSLQDENHYYLGDGVYLRGKGFASSLDLIINVVRTNQKDPIHTRTVTTDVYGNFGTGLNPILVWDIPSDLSYLGQYKVEALNGSDKIASDNFSVLQKGQNPPDPTYSISGMVWHDVDEEGDRDESVGLADFTIELYAGDSPVATAVTLTDGLYVFSGLSAGTYNVIAIRPAGSAWEMSYPEPGYYKEVTVGSEEGNAIDKDFGYFEPAVTPETYSISGTVWNDTEDDKNYDEGDSGIEGWTVRLVEEAVRPMSLATEFMPLETTTDSNGLYSFDGLAGDYYYKVIVTPESGWENTEPDTNEQSIHIYNEDVTGVNFGYRQQEQNPPEQTYSISGTVWNDKNGDGINDQDEAGLEDWTLTLVTNEIQPMSLISELPTCETGKDGSYSFDELNPGFYKVVVTPKDDWKNTYPGSNEQSGPVPVNDEDVTGIDFGYYLPSTTPVQNAGITVKKSVSPSSAKVGDTVAYTISVNNSGDIPFNLVEVDDELIGFSKTLEMLDKSQTEEWTINYTLKSIDFINDKFTNTVTTRGYWGEENTNSITDFATAVVTKATSGGSTPTTGGGGGSKNRPPIAVDDFVSTNYNYAVEIEVLKNDSDPDGHRIEVVSIDTKDTLGTATLKSDGTVIYIPPKDFFGTDTFMYTIKDYPGLTDTATVTVIVNPQATSQIIVEPEPPTVGPSEPSKPNEPIKGDLPQTGGSYAWAVVSGITLLGAGKSLFRRRLS